MKKQMTLAEAELNARIKAVQEATYGYKHAARDDLREFVHSALKAKFPPAKAVRSRAAA